MPIALILWYYLVPRHTFSDRRDVLGNYDGNPFSPPFAFKSSQLQSTSSIMAPEVKRTSLAAAMSPLYSTAIDMVTALQMRFASSLLSFTAPARSDSNQTTDQYQFTRRIRARSADDAAGPVHNDLSVDASFVHQMNNGSSRVWSTPECRPMQIKAVETILFDPACEGKLLVVDRTGGGKSHVLRMIATFVGGIIVLIAPLLA